MGKARVLIAVLLLVAVALPLAADTDTTRWENRLKTLYNDIVLEVKAAEDPAEKRALLNSTLDKTLRAVDRVEALARLSDGQAEAMAQYRAAVQEKHDELNGLDGFPAVADVDLNGFADYMVQDLEQARSTIVMSGAALIILILILIILL